MILYAFCCGPFYNPGQKLLVKAIKTLKPHLIRSPSSIINVGMSISSSMTKTNIDTGVGAKLRRKYTKVLFCVTKTLKTYLILPPSPIINVSMSISSSKESTQMCCFVLQICFCHYFCPGLQTSIKQISLQGWYVSM